MKVEQTIKVSLRGRDYWLKTDLKERELRKLIEEVERKIKEFEESLGLEISEEKVYLLTALNFALSAHEFKREIDLYKDKLRRWSNLIDKGLGDENYKNQL